MKRLVILPRAEVDIFEAAIWYEAERDGLGRDFAADFDGLLARIQSFPMQFPEMESQVRRAMLSRFPYAVFFLVEEEVLAVVRGRAPPPGSTHMEGPKIACLGAAEPRTPEIAMAHDTPAEGDGMNPRSWR